MRINKIKKRRSIFFEQTPWLICTPKIFNSQGCATAQNFSQKNFLPLTAKNFQGVICQQGVCSNCVDGTTEFLFFFAPLFFELLKKQRGTCFERLRFCDLGARKISAERKKPALLERAGLWYNGFKQTVRQHRLRHYISAGRECKSPFLRFQPKLGDFSREKCTKSRIDFSIHSFQDTLFDLPKLERQVFLWLKAEKQFRKGRTTKEQEQGRELILAQFIRTVRRRVGKIFSGNSLQSA